MPTQTSPQSRFYSLDALRGFAALAVVLTHWTELFCKGTQHLSVDTARLPFHAVLGPIYSQGWRAVDIFFCLSGFIFFSLYSARIATRQISVGQFWLLRFSRLYPLHFLTLLIVAASQRIMLATQGSFQTVPTNDLNHFIQHLFFVSSWGFGAVSFNGPVWSVSVEIALYAIFFAACAAGWRRWPQVALLIAVGFALQFNNRFCAIGRGMCDFFIGGLCAILFASMRASKKGGNPLVFGVVAIAGWAIAACNLQFGWLTQIATFVLGADTLIAGHRPEHLMTHFGFQLLPFQVLPIPFTILALACWEDRAAHVFRRLSFLGDISYSSYLLHFPLQLACIALATYFGWDSSIYYSYVVFFAFFTVLLLLSLASFHFFERPMQRWIRDRFSPAASAMPPPVAVTT